MPRTVSLGSNRHSQRILFTALRRFRGRLSVTDLLVATIHQLLHFYRAFDLIIVDEVDAFPYEGDQQLRFGLMNALKATGCLSYLSATPSDALPKRNNKFCSGKKKMPLRFHQRPLIVPQLIWYEGWRNVYQTKRRLRRLLFHLATPISNKFCLSFLPKYCFYGNG